MTRSRLPSRTLRVVRELRRERISARKIAARLGVSPVSVLKVARNVEALDLDELERDEAENDERGFEYVVDENALPSRCPTCGRVVAPPCLRCFLEARGVGEPSELSLEEAFFYDGVSPFGVDLTGVERVRYDKIRALKESKKSAGRRPVLNDDELASLFGRDAND
ncbi:MAG: hypothetical protein IJO06_04715 [Thermoguttaceae bacterium]|nr:hypothetical protein [Thermoguttaceae bacterium]